MRKKILLSFLVLSFCLPLLAEENQVMEVNQEETAQKTRLVLGPELAMLSRNGKSLMSFGAHFGLEYGLTDRLAVSAGLHQGFATSGFLSPSFTKFALTLTHALTGSVIVREDKVSLNSRKVFRSANFPSGGFRAHLSLSEYLFPVTGGSLLYPAFGVGASYEFPSEESYSIALGIRAETLFNASDSVSAIQPFVKILFWI